MCARYNEVNTMWFITVMEYLIEDDKYIARHGDKRTWGYYEEYETAVQALHENWCDMNEGIYGIALLEKYGPGISPWCEGRQWFRYDREIQGYIEMEEPEFIKCIVNFAIG